jgi:hypothetical protein
MCQHVPSERARFKTAPLSSKQVCCMVDVVHIKERTHRLRPSHVRRDLPEQGDNDAKFP